MFATPSSSNNPANSPASPSGEMPSGEMPSDNIPSGEMPEEASKEYCEKESKHLLTLEALDRKHAAEIAHKIKLHEARMGDMEQEHNVQVHRQRKEHKETIALIEQERLELVVKRVNNKHDHIQEMHNAIEVHAQILDDISKSFHKKHELLKKNYEDWLDTQNAHIETITKRIQREHDEKLANLKKQYEEELIALKDKHDSHITAEECVFSMRLEQLREKHEIDIERKVAAHRDILRLADISAELYKSKLPRDPNQS